MHGVFPREAEMDGGMDDGLGEALGGFDAALSRFRAALEAYPALSDTLFADTGTWTQLLTYKLVPHLAGDGCLVVSIAGGTNTGKSTVFDILAGGDLSPIRSTAAATCRPVLAANGRRAKECCEGKLVPEFRVCMLEDPEWAMDRDRDPKALFVVCVEDMPDHLVLLDTPDVDSIERYHWEIAEHLRAAGDVVVAVLTAEKYQDERVVAFFKQAQSSGRIVLPVMNKANPERDYAVARAQLDAFCGAVGIKEPICFVVPHDFDLAGAVDEGAVLSLEGDYGLYDFLESLEVGQLKADVYGETVSHFAKESGAFLRRAREMAESLRAVEAELTARLTAAAEAYDPQPDARVGRVLHEYIKARRGVFGRTFGKVGAAVSRRLSPLRVAAERALRRGAPSRPGDFPAEDVLRERRADEVFTAGQRLAAGLVESAAILSEPAGALLREGLASLNTDKAIEAAAAETLGGGGISASFREHVEKTMDLWWTEHPVTRGVLRELDAILMVAPAAVAVPLSFFTAGVGVPEATAVAGILGGEFFSKVLVHQFSDYWLDLLRPWREERRENLRQALEAHIAGPALAKLRAAAEILEGKDVATMKGCLEVCRKAL